MFEIDKILSQIPQTSPESNQSFTSEVYPLLKSENEHIMMQAELMESITLVQSIPLEVNDTQYILD